MIEREIFKIGTIAYYVPSFDVVLSGKVVDVYEDGIFRNVTIETEEGEKISDSDNRFSTEYPEIVNYWNFAPQPKKYFDRYQQKTVTLAELRKSFEYNRENQIGFHTFDNMISHLLKNILIILTH